MNRSGALEVLLFFARIVPTRLPTGRELSPKVQSAQQKFLRAAARAPPSHTFSSTTAHRSIFGGKIRQPSRQTATGYRHTTFSLIFQSLNGVFRFYDNKFEYSSTLNYY
jgi:hypothetical protein